MSTVKLVQSLFVTFGCLIGKVSTLETAGHVALIAPFLFTLFTSPVSFKRAFIFTRITVNSVMASGHHGKGHLPYSATFVGNCATIKNQIQSPSVGNTCELLHVCVCRCLLVGTNTYEP